MSLYKIPVFLVVTTISACAIQTAQVESVSPLKPAAEVETVMPSIPSAIDIQGAEGLQLLFPPVGVSSEQSAWFTTPDQQERLLVNAPDPLSSALVDLEFSRLVTEVDTTHTEQPGDLWARMRAGFALPDVRNPRIDNELRWYVGHPAYLDRVVERARPYLHFVVEQAEEIGVPLEMALLPIVESAYQPFAYSHGRAAGIWQFIPSTGRIYGLKQNWWYDGRRDIVASTRAALTYLRKLYDFVGEDWLLALAAYNSGAGTVLRAKRQNSQRGKLTDFWSLKLPVETRSYVPRLLALKLIFDNPTDYGLDIASIPDEPYFDVVDVGSQIDLALAAELANIELEELYQLNPGHNRWATDPDGHHQLVIPLEVVDTFRESLEALPPRQRVNWRRHRIGSGESLLTIAKKYQTTVEVIRDVNQLRGSMIRAGDHLMIPVATRSLSTYTLSQSQRTDTIKNTQRSGQRIEHVVRSGESFWEISKKYGVGVRALAKWNAMAPTDTLKAGQTLVVWSKRSVPAATTGNLPVATNQKIRYVVRKGDSIARISQKFRVRVSDVLRWNSLTERSYIHPGQKLTLYVDIRKQSGTI